MQTALITGGSRGIGAAMVRAFAGQGWRTAFSYCHSQAQAQALQQACGALPFCADLRDPVQTGHFLDQAVAQLSHVDALIVNAAMPAAGLMTDMTLAQWDDLFALNVRSAFLCCKRILPLMRQHGGGSVLFVSSIWGLRGASCEAAYAASKAALVGLGRSLAREWGPCGIRVNCLAPGVIDTDMLSGYGPDAKAALQQATPLDRLGTPQEVANCALYLCSSQAAFITGQVIGVDGGFCA